MQEFVDVYDPTISFWRKNVALFFHGETRTIWDAFFNLFGDEYTKFSLVYNSAILEEKIVPAKLVIQLVIPIF